MNVNLDQLFVSPDVSLRDAIVRLDENRWGIVLVVDQEQKLIGTITDGDIRRAILSDVDLANPVSCLLVAKRGSRYVHPITAPFGSDRGYLFTILQQHKISHLPLVDDEQHVLDLVTRNEFLADSETPSNAVIMAGGLGARMSPLTDYIPKPMLPIGDKPLMERIIDQLKVVGITQVNLAVHYKAEKISEYFGDGTDFGVEINYVSEDTPLGTAGALGLLEVPQGTTLIMNGDILTNVNFHTMVAYHKENDADLTMAVQKYDVHVPYGVIESDGAIVTRVIEKPELNYFVNAGIYLVEPIVFNQIPRGQPFDMTDLVQKLLENGDTVSAFPIHEYWIDIGNRSDYQKAQEDIKSWK